jgi:tetratricopeptide (TPR) repeat protein
MGILGRRAIADRDQMLEAAARARSRGRRRKAIALYRQVLATDRSNADLHAKLAPLLAETGQDFDAWNSYRATAQAALRAGREDRALAIYEQASKHLPREIQIWQALARLLARQGDEDAAVETLVDASRHFRLPFMRAQAIHLLRRARTIDPWHFETVIELAALLRRCEQRAEARNLLDGLAERASGRRLRRVRAAQLRLGPGARTLWTWLRTRQDEPTEREPLPSRQDDPTEREPLRAVASEVVPLRAVRR